MRKTFAAAAAFCLFAAPALGADEMIDPQTYICAEIVASSVDGQPPLYEALQLDGFHAAKNGLVVADPDTLPPMLIEVSDSCAAKPEEKALSHWQESRRRHAAPADGPWRADKTTCADYVANPDDGSGFVIWLDGYNRGKKGTSASILSSQQALDSFLAACKANPKRLMLDVLAENAK